MTELNVTLHTVLDAALRDQWQQLFAGLSRKNLFQHIAWQEAFIDGHYQPEKHGTLVFAVATMGDRPVAIVPLMYRSDRRYGIPVRVIELMHPTDMGVRDFPIADGADTKNIIDTILYKTLPAAGYRWDIAEIKGAVENSTAHLAFQAAAGLKIAEYDHDSNRLKSVAGRDQCFSLISKSHIKKTKRKRKHFETLGKVDYELITAAEDLPRAYEIFLAIEDSGWKGSDGLKTSLRNDIPQKRFYESMIANTAPELNFCAIILRLNQEPVAAKLCTKTGDTLFMLKISYDDRYQEHSPGSLLLLYLLEQFSEDEQVDYISFITGQQWMWRWSAERQPVFWCQIFNSTAAGLLFAAANHTKALVRRIKNKTQHNNHADTLEPEKVDNDS